MCSKGFITAYNLKDLIERKKQERASLFLITKDDNPYFYE